MQKTGIVTDNRYMNHITEAGHPESPLRLKSVYAMTESSFTHSDFTKIPSRKATDKELLLVHSSNYLKRIAATSGKPFTALTPDTHTSADSYDAALLATGGLLEAISKVVSGEFANAFALIRPPGHHAEKSRAMGYCLFNNIAIGAAFARQILGLKRVLIADWDVHHGNGTQHAFENDNHILFFSTHQYPLFPGTGLFTEAGRDKGEGYTINLPLPKGYGDADFVSLFELLLRPVAMQFEPELILVSAGFDTHRSDPMGSMKMTAPGFAALTRSVMEIARVCCNGRLVLCLEGGYHVKALADSVKAVLLELSEKTCCNLSELIHQANQKKVTYAIHRCTHVHQQFWHFNIH